MDRIEVRTPHLWRDTYGYDPATYCSLCHASNYETRTEFCEDWLVEKQVRKEKAEHRHAPTEAAWQRAREVLTEAEWALMELHLKRPYRIIDRIVVSP